MKYIFIIVLSFLFSGSLLAQKMIPFRHGDIWGYLDKSGITIVEATYVSADELFHNRGRVSKDGKYGFIDDNGQLVIDCIYENATNFSKYRYASVSKDGQKYCINTNNEETRCIKGCGLTAIAIHFDTYKKDGKIGLYRKILLQEPRPSILFPPTWDNLEENNRGYAAVKKGKRWAIIDDSGLNMTPYLYDTIIVNINDGHFLVSQNGKYGLLTSNGDTFIKPKYHKLTFYSENHLAKAWQDEKFWFYIDEQGREYYRKAD